ncbi:MAG: helix-hairpin-helix domain-containing protein [Candidatus Cloacimonetes bacterium]|nr:helix-hairpin-helix domain-containing protein [Candidatus Cloacimonadota bacterium]
MVNLQDSQLTAISEEIAEKLQLKKNQTASAISFFENGSTIPFIARYRKEATRFLNEIQLRKIEDLFLEIKKRESRKKDILKLLKKKDVLNPKLIKLLNQAQNIQELDDIYKPFRSNKKTKADHAREMNLSNAVNFLKKASYKYDAYLSNFIKNSKELFKVDDVLEQVGYIIAEEISQKIEIKKFVHNFFIEKAFIESTKKKNAVDLKKTYQDYYDFRQGLKKIPSYRVLSINRGEKEKVLKVNIRIPFQPIYEILKIYGIKRRNPYYENFLTFAKDSFNRLIEPQIIRHVRTQITQKVELASINIFSKNLRSLLLTPPLKKKMILGIDPAFRSGCKLALIDENGFLITHNKIFPNQPVANQEESIKIMNSLYKKYKFPLIAIGNGTASRETTDFISNWIELEKIETSFIITSESGASVYSASEIAIEEFPKLDLTYRSAISIARRVLNPLDEFVKIPPEAIGIGMYQHDITNNLLIQHLNREVESVVNLIGVDINTASKFLLQYISGLSKSTAQNIVDYRDRFGVFKNREQLLKVKGIGSKAYELSAGFCRVPQSDNPLDDTIIHPESYDEAFKILELIGFSKSKIKANWSKIKKKIELINYQKTCTKLNISEFKFKQIVQAISANNDPRDFIPQPLLTNKLRSIKDLSVGLVLQGSITNIVDFGAFVYMGTKVNGMIHKSQMKPNLHPLEQLFIGQIVKVEILNIDIERERIGLKLIY